MANLTEYGGADGYAARLKNARLADAAGHPLSLVSVDHTQHEAQAWIQYADGQQVMVPVSLLVQSVDGEYRLPFSVKPSSAGDDASLTVPVLQEELQVATRAIDTGKGIRLHKKVLVQEQIVDPPLRRDQLAVEHIPVNRVITEGDVPEPRYDGDTLVVPVLEEVLVVQKQLLLKEEVRITRNRLQVSEPRTMQVRSEHVDIERFDESSR